MISQFASQHKEKEIGTNKIASTAIVWEETTEQCFGIPNEKQLVDTPYQLFEISLSQGRVHRFFIENIVYIVWFDPEHKLYQHKN